MACISAAALARFATFDLWTLSATRELEMFTLLSTLPTLCNTLVATSAMPASRELSTSCRCTSPSFASASFIAVMSFEMPSVPMIWLPSLRSGILEVSAQVSRPSLNISFSILPITGWPERMMACSSS